jgi:phosphopantothenoylcysteine synthetase/decarboxylase
MSRPDRTPGETSLPDLTGRRLLVTSGPTRGPIDRVRYISNKSTGRLGTAIAAKALAAGAEVTFVYGSESLVPDPHPALLLVEVETVSDLLTAVKRELTRKPHDAIIHLMAVLDYEPAEFHPEKTASGKREWVVRLKPTPKVIARLKEWAPGALLVGFKLEDRLPDAELIAEAQALAQKNGAAFVVANNLAEIEAGRHRALFVAPAGAVLAEVVGKEAIADELLRQVARLLKE